MFTTGKILFAFFFFIAFSIGMFYAYKKDFNVNTIHFSGSRKTLIYIIIVMSLLFMFVKLRHYL
jgi:hypothetical protein